MKRLMSLVLVTALTAFSASAMACPKGTTLTGGTGMHHQGGKCVANGLLKQQAQASKKAAAHSTKVKVSHTNSKKVSSAKPVKTTAVKPVMPTTNPQTSVAPAMSANPKL